MSDKSEINDYLMREFGSETEERSTPTEDWPFALYPLGEINVAVEITIVYNFTHKGEAFFALSGSELSYLSQAGMGFEDLCLQELGSAWIGAREPIPLNTVYISDNPIPTTQERRAAIQQLISDTPLTGSNIEIEEGLYLCATHHYLALVQDEDKEVGHVIGTGIVPQTVGFPEADSWQRLALAIGVLLDAGQLGDTPFR